jgi:hypothetical protein
MNGSKSMKVDMVNMEEMMKDPNANILGGGEGEASVDAIPDLDALTSNIMDILEYLENPDVKKICAINDSAIRMKLYNDYADTVPLKFIDLFLERDPEQKAESVERTLKWIEVLAKVKAGKADLEKESQKLVEEVNNRYVYSKYGSKQAFERALKKELEKERRSGKDASQGF